MNSYLVACNSISTNAIKYPSKNFNQLRFIILQFVAKKAYEFR
jgi:hypothetical protein